MNFLIPYLSFFMAEPSDTPVWLKEKGRSLNKVVSVAESYYFCIRNEKAKQSFESIKK